MASFQAKIGRSYDHNSGVASQAGFLRNNLRLFVGKKLFIFLFLFSIFLFCLWQHSSMLKQYLSFYAVIFFINEDLYLKLLLLLFFHFSRLWWLKDAPKRKTTLNLRKNKTQWEMNQSMWGFLGDSRDREGSWDKFRCVRCWLSAIITVCISMQLGMLKRSNFTLRNVSLELLFFPLYPNFLLDNFTSYFKKFTTIEKNISKAIDLKILFLRWTKIFF